MYITLRITQLPNQSSFRWKANYKGRKSQNRCLKCERLSCLAFQSTSSFSPPFFNYFPLSYRSYFALNPIPTPLLLFFIPLSSPLTVLSSSWVLYFPSSEESWCHLYLALKSITRKRAERYNLPKLIDRMNFSNINSTLISNILPNSKF